MTLFKQSQFSKIKSPIYITNLVQNINGNVYDIPHLIFPGYSYSRNTSFLDAVALIGIQKELMYNQNLENIHFNNPYLEEKHLLTKYKKSSASEEESIWKNQTYYYSRDINCEGHIIRIQQDRDNVIIVTDQYETVILDKELNVLFKSRMLQNKMGTIHQDYNITKILDIQTSIYKEWDIVGTISLRSENKTLYVTFNIDQSNLYYFDITISNDEELLLGEKSSMFTSLSNDIQSYKVLAKYLNTYKPQQTQMINYDQQGNYSYYQTPLFLLLTDFNSNKTYSFIKKRGVVITSNQEDKLTFIYPSASLTTKSQQGKVDIFSQTLNIDQLKSELNYVTKISMQNSVVEANQKVDLTKIYASNSIVFEPITTNIATKPVVIFITPLGHLTVLNQNNGKRLYITQVNITNETDNCQLKLLNVNNNTLISVQIQKQTYIYNLHDLKLIAEMQIPNQEILSQDTLSLQWSELTQELNTNIFSTKMSAFQDDEVIINIRGPLMDVIGVASQEGDLFVLYISRVVMIIFIGCILMASFNIIKEKQFVYDEK